MTGRIGPQESYSPADSLPADIVQTSNIVDSAVDYSKVATGFVVDRAYAEYTGSTALTVNIPSDNTIPQNTEGTQVASASINMKSATNRLRVTFSCFGAASVAARMIAAVFRNSVANAIYASETYITNNTLDNVLSFSFEYVPGASGTETVAVRVGGAAANVYLNSDASSALFGGVAKAALVLEEIKA